LVRQLLSLRKPKEKLFPFSALAFRRLFKHVCSELGLSSSYVPHSLRHGGATFMHRAGRSIADIRHRGRWAAVKSAEHYIQSGPALLLQTSVPPAISSRADILAKNVVTAFSLAQSH
jgi:integrase